MFNHPIEVPDYMTMITTNDTENVYVFCLVNVQKKMKKKESIQVVIFI